MVLRSASGKSLDYYDLGKRAEKILGSLFLCWIALSYVQDQNPISWLGWSLWQFLTLFLLCGGFGGWIAAMLMGF